MIVTVLLVYEMEEIHMMMTNAATNSVKFFLVNFDFINEISICIGCKTHNLRETYIVIYSVYRICVCLL